MNLNFRDSIFPILRKNTSELEKERIAVIKSIYDKLDGEQLSWILVFKNIFTFGLILTALIITCNISTTYLNRNNIISMSSMFEQQNDKLNNIITSIDTVIRFQQNINTKTFQQDRTEFVSIQKDYNK